jgi:hypothetical protein
MWIPKDSDFTVCCLCLSKYQIFRILSFDGKLECCYLQHWNWGKRLITDEFNPLNAEWNAICHLLALLGAHIILHVSRVMVNINFVVSIDVPNKPQWTEPLTWSHVKMQVCIFVILRNSHAFHSPLMYFFSIPFKTPSVRYDIIYLLTAVGLSPGGSTHLHTNNT